MKKKKYIIRRWTEHFKEEYAGSLIAAIHIKRFLQVEEPGYTERTSGERMVFEKEWK